MLKRRDYIKSKGFNLIEDGVGNPNEFDEAFQPIDFAKMRVGLRTIDDVTLNLGSYKQVNRNYGDKEFVLRAIARHDAEAMREISKFFYESNGLYRGLCRYAASLYRYDWYVTPYVNDESDKNKKLLKDFSNVLLYLDKSNIKMACRKIALNIMRDGSYYALLIDFDDKIGLQQLPSKYCRCRFYSGTTPIVELNLQFFDAYFSNTQQRLQVLKTFPKDIQQAYVAYKQGKLKGDYPGDRTCWIALEAGSAIKLSLEDDDFPPFIGAIPSIIDLDQAQDLDRKKTMQQLLKIIVQKLPLDKNGDLIFDVDEAKDIHNNAVAMLKRAIGVDVLTTFADIEKIDTKDSNSQTTRDDLEKVERTVYNNASISKNLFNADGNLAVSNSVLVDEASMRDLPLQFEDLFNRLIEKFNRKNHYEFRFSMLGTTQFNYEKMSKNYKDNAQMGCSLLLPMIALGESQSTLLATIHFENEILKLAEKMIPPVTSNTQSAKNLDKSEQGNTSKNQNIQVTKETKEVGRPQKDESEKSDKTIQNVESQS